MIATPIGDGGKTRINLASNESALGPSPQALAAARSALDSIERLLVEGPALDVPGATCDSVVRSRSSVLATRAPRPLGGPESRDARARGRVPPRSRLRHGRGTVRRALPASDLAAATRTNPQVLVGASPRGALALLKLVVAGVTVLGSVLVTRIRSVD